MNNTNSTPVLASPSSSSELEDTDDMSELEPVCKKPKTKEENVNISHRCVESCDHEASKCHQQDHMDHHLTSARCSSMHSLAIQTSTASGSGLSGRHSASPPRPTGSSASSSATATSIGSRGGSSSPPGGGRGGSVSPGFSGNTLNDNRLMQCQDCQEGCVSRGTGAHCRGAGCRCMEGTGGGCVGVPCRNMMGIETPVPGPSRSNPGSCYHGRGGTAGGTAGAGCSRGFLCTSRLQCTRPTSSYVAKSVHSGSKSLARGRGGSAEKDGKSGRSSGSNHRSSAGSSGTAGRMLKEHWQVGVTRTGQDQVNRTGQDQNTRTDTEQAKSRTDDQLKVNTRGPLDDRRGLLEDRRGGGVCGEEQQIRGEQIKGRGEGWREDGVGRCRMGEGGVRGAEEQISSSQCGEPAEVAKLQAKLRLRENELASQKQENERFLRELQESVECPVCFCVPRAPPVPCCQNGHVICSRCKDKVEVCPTCRIPMTNCVSQVAATIIQRIQHPCDFRDAGCETRCDINAIDEHEERCMFRLVRCPHWACDEMISLTALTSHVIGAECGDNYMAKPLPYQEEIEYTRALDDRDGSSFWRPSLLQYQNITFYLQIEKSGKNGQWYFFVQMEASSTECEQFETKITVCKNTYSDRFSISYHGKVCPIDIKGAEELDQGGCGLSVRDAVMERIFTVDTTSGQEANNKEGGRGHNSGEKEEGEVGDHGEEGEGERYKFWVKVDIFNVEE